LWLLLFLLWILLGSWSAPPVPRGEQPPRRRRPLGLTVYVLQDLLGYGELAFSCRSLSAILLLGARRRLQRLPISRIWREAETKSCGRQSAVPAFAPAGVTVAGIILAPPSRNRPDPIQGFHDPPSPFASGCCSTRLLRAPCWFRPSCNLRPASE